MSPVKNKNEIDKHVSPLPDRIFPLPKVIFTDVDDTLTWEGQLPVETFIALQKLYQANITVVPVTGASAGWCDCLIKTWPIKHIIGENGALSMAKGDDGIVSVNFAKDAAQAHRDLSRLKQIGDELHGLYPAIDYTQDQPYRLTDIAFDIGQTVTVKEEVTVKATQWLGSQGVQARRSSIHINVWIGSHSKATGAINWLEQHNLPQNSCLFIGDSPNDESMFERFPHSVGVANIDRFLVDMQFKPSYITTHPGGYGFVDLANTLLGTEIGA